MCNPLVILGAAAWHGCKKYHNRVDLLLHSLYCTSLPQIGFLQSWVNCCPLGDVITGKSLSLPAEATGLGFAMRQYHGAVLWGWVILPGACGAVLHKPGKAVSVWLLGKSLVLHVNKAGQLQESRDRKGSPAFFLQIWVIRKAQLQRSFRPPLN